MNNVGLDNTIPISGFEFLTVPLHRAVPNGRYRDPGPGGPTVEYSPLAGSRGDRIVAGSLYAVIATLINFLNSSMAAHMIGILTGLGVAASVSVWIATLRGIGQSSARLGEVLSGSRLHPLSLKIGRAHV